MRKHSNLNYYRHLLRKFSDLHKRLQNQELSGAMKRILKERLSKTYKKLIRLQPKLGIKLAGTTLALFMASANLNAQKFVPDSNLMQKDYIMEVSQAIPTIVDFNNDGKNDIVLRLRDFYNSNTYYQYLENVGNERFLLKDTLKDENGNNINLVQGNPSFADLDDDGDMDLYIGSYSGQIFVFENDGSGNFTSNGYLKDKNDVEILGGYYWNYPVFADVDDDGDLDLYYCAYDVYTYHSTIKFYENTPDGLVYNSELSDADGNTITNYDYMSIAFADLDGDSDLDLLTGIQYGGVSDPPRIRYYTNENGSFSLGGYLADENGDLLSKENLISYTYIATGDINSDGIDDVLYGGVKEGIHYCLGNADHTLQPYKNLTIREYQIVRTATIFTPFITDMNNDGYNDLLGQYSKSVSTKDYILLYSGRPDGYFSPPDTLKTATGDYVGVDGIYNVFGIDINEDTYKDLIISSTTDNLGFISYNNGDGTYTVPDTLREPNGNILDIKGHPMIFMNDFDNDDDLDFYCGNSRGYVLMFKNNGDFRFELYDSLRNSNNEIIVNEFNAIPFFYDFDEDSDLDMFINDMSGYIFYYEKQDDGYVFSDTVRNKNAEPLHFNNYTRFSIFDNGNCTPSIAITAYYNINPVLYHFLDTIAPTISCISDTTVFINNTENYTISGTIFDPEVTDNCNVDEISNSFNGLETLNGAVIPVGTTTITWTATDIDGNSTSCSFAITVNQTTQVAENNSDIKIYPNPANKFFEISGSASVNKLEILDITGKRIKVLNFNNNSGIITVNIENLKSGIYFIKISDMEETRIFKLIKE